MDVEMLVRGYVLGLAARGYVLAPLDLLARRLRRRLGLEWEELREVLSMVRWAGPWHFWTGLEPAEGDVFCFVERCGRRLPYLAYLRGGRYFLAGGVSGVYDSLVHAVYDVEGEERVDVAVKLCSYRFKVLSASIYG